MKMKWLKHIRASMFTFALLLALTPGLNASELPQGSVRLSYDGIGTPESFVYTFMLRSIVGTTEKSELNELIWFNLNSTWDSRQQAWVSPTSESIRFTRKDIKIIVNRMQADLRKIEARHKGFMNSICNVRKNSAVELYPMLRKRDDQMLSQAIDLWQKTQSFLGEPAAGALRGWLSQLSDGVQYTFYDHEKLWHGKEAQFLDSYQTDCDHFQGGQH